MVVCNAQRKTWYMRGFLRSSKPSMLKGLRRTAAVIM
jgi:hypothetical protein